MRGPGVNDERFTEEVEAGRFSVDAQGRIWRHILNNKPAEPQRAEYRLENGYLRVLWYHGRCYGVRARNAVWRYYHGSVPADAIIVHKNGVRGDNRPENLEASFPRRERSQRYCLTAGQVEALRRTYHAGGFTQEQLAQRYGVAQSYVSGIVRGELRAEVGGPISENNRSKLTEQDAREIRGRYAAGGITYAELAEDYPVVATNICHVVHGLQFADAGGPIRGARGR
jgi:hypothetical protein